MISFRKLGFSLELAMLIPQPPVVTLKIEAANPHPSLHPVEWFCPKANVWLQLNLLFQFHYFGDDHPLRFPFMSQGKEVTLNLQEMFVQD